MVYLNEISKDEEVIVIESGVASKRSG